MSRLSDTGLDVPSLSELQTLIEDNLRTRFGSSINLLPNTVFAQLVGSQAFRDDQTWQAIQDLYGGLDPAGAAGILLDYMCARVGVVRLPATESSVTLTLDLDAATTVPAGSLVSHETTGVQFRLRDDVTSTTAGEYEGVALSVDVGPVEASANTLTQIDTPVTGWNTVTNDAQATPGSFVETDAALRLRRDDLLTIRAGSTLDAITADVRAVENVLVVKGYENTTSVVDADSRPPHSYEMVIFDNAADDDSIAQAIFDSGPAGIESFSFSVDSGTAIDADDNEHTIAFTRATTVPIFFEIDVTKNEDYPVDGDDQVAAALAGAGDELAIGETLYASAFYGAVFQVAGVVAITDLRVDDVEPAVTTSVDLSVREIPTFDAGDVVVNSIDE